MDPTDAYLAEIGYIPQITPAGRVIMVNPAAYPLSDEFLANEDAYIELTDEQQRVLDEDLEDKGFDPYAEADFAWVHDLYHSED